MRTNGVLQDVEQSQGGVDTTVSWPNLPAAICLSNRAAALLKLGNPEQALASAQKACKTCPEYLKGRRRVQSAHTALGDAAAARKLGKEIWQYETALKNFAWNGIALLFSEWISEWDFICVYEPKRQKFFARRLAGVFGVGGSASLVPFGGGQWMMLALNYMDESFTRQKVDCYHFCPVDNANDDALDEPPHGRASSTALKHVPRLLPRFLARLEAPSSSGGSGVTVRSLTLGRGLLPHVTLIKQTLKDDFPMIIVSEAVATRLSMGH